jgi:hypothetical protein
LPNADSIATATIDDETGNQQSFEIWMGKELSDSTFLTQTYQGRSFGR